MSVAYREVSSGFGAQPNLTVTKPAGTVDGDFLLIAFQMYMADASKTVITPPVGFTQLYTTDWFATANLRTFVWWKIAASEPASWPVVTNAVVGHAAMWGALACSSPVAANPIADSSQNPETVIKNGNYPATSVNAANATDLLVYLSMTRKSGTGNRTPPTGFTERYDITEGGADNGQDLATKVAGATGATGTVTGTGTNANAPSVNYLIAVRGDPVVTFVPQVFVY